MIANRSRSTRQEPKGGSYADAQVVFDNQRGERCRVATTGTTFKQLNHGWNAYPNFSTEKVVVGQHCVDLYFLLNDIIYDDIDEGEYGLLRFKNCSHYLESWTNDHAFILGQCRFSRICEKWGEFYEVSGDLLLQECPEEWTVLSETVAPRHFLFYMRDSAFECDAEDWEFIRAGLNPGEVGASS